MGEFVVLSCYGKGDWVPFFIRAYDGIKGRKLKNIKNRHSHCVRLLNKYGRDAAERFIVSR